jgi:hypothetical protein
MVAVGMTPVMVPRAAAAAAAEAAAEATTTITTTPAKRSNLEQLYAEVNSKSNTLTYTFNKCQTIIIPSSLIQDHVQSHR